ncbi:hypothetical protein PR048_013343 [Dryococelus australis]|uniref:Potassium channel domain-containing protein n=1 Tax=Dryococelus australis TaxID=614101 RepID=A0ABQ9HRX2_9NEOP|nr:hypothetical protein PR048_013343 [Dryococelus australis]
MELSELAIVWGIPCHGGSLERNVIIDNMAATPGVLSTELVDGFELGYLDNPCKNELLYTTHIMGVRMGYDNLTTEDETGSVRTPVLFNKYAVDDDEIARPSRMSRSLDRRSMKEKQLSRTVQVGHHLTVNTPNTPSLPQVSHGGNIDSPKSIDRRREEAVSPTPSIISHRYQEELGGSTSPSLTYARSSMPGGFITRQASFKQKHQRLSRLREDVDYEDYEEFGLMGYDYEDSNSAYFCFITLTTIGFGDFVPARRVQKTDAGVSIALCSLYLLFGIALLAMSFNLVQEEVINNVKAIAKHLGIVKDDEDEEDHE